MPNGSRSRKLELDWQAPISSLSLLITSLAWRQDHNGFTQQDPGFLDLVNNKSAEITRIYLPLMHTACSAVATTAYAARTM